MKDFDFEQKLKAQDLTRAINAGQTGYEIRHPEALRAFQATLKELPELPPKYTRPSVWDSLAPQRIRLDDDDFNLIIKEKYLLNNKHPETYQPWFYEPQRPGTLAAEMQGLIGYKNNPFIGDDGKDYPSMKAVRAANKRHFEKEYSPTREGYDQMERDEAVYWDRERPFSESRYYEPEPKWPAKLRVFRVDSAGQVLPEYIELSVLDSLIPRIILDNNSFIEKEKYLLNNNKPEKYTLFDELQRPDPLALARQIRLRQERKNPKLFA